jgi:hypothetical protein
MADETNLRILGRSRKAPQVGDLFAMQIPDGRYLFGRVILFEPPRETAPGPNCTLIYIYSTLEKVCVPDYSLMTPERLLLAPLWTNRKGWSVGVFKTVDHLPLKPSDLLAQHCFLDPTSWHGVRYLDEQGRTLPRRYDPCGSWGLGSYLFVDDEVSRALGIPLASDEQR